MPNQRKKFFLSSDISHNMGPLRSRNRDSNVEKEGPRDSSQTPSTSSQYDQEYKPRFTLGILRDKQTDSVPGKLLLHPQHNATYEADIDTRLCPPAVWCVEAQRSLGYATCPSRFILIVSAFAISVLVTKWKLPPKSKDTRSGKETHSRRQDHLGSTA